MTKYDKSLGNFVKKHIRFYRDISVDVNRPFGRVSITDDSGGEIFLQNDEGYDFIDRADALYQKTGNIDMDQAYLFIATDYADAIE